MRRVHQPDNPVVHIAGQLGRQVRGAEARRKLRHLRHRRQRNLCAPGSGFRQIHPRIAVLLPARVAGRINFRRLQHIEAGQRRNLRALAGARLEFPAMVFALHLLAVEPSGRKRNSAMRAKVAHGKQRAIALAPKQQRHPQQQRRAGLSGGNAGRTCSRVPVAEDQLRRRPRLGRRLAGVLRIRTHLHHPMISVGNGFAGGLVLPLSPFFVIPQGSAVVLVFIRSLHFQRKSIG